MLCNALIYCDVKGEKFICELVGFICLDADMLCVREHIFQNHGIIYNVYYNMHRDAICPRYASENAPMLCRNVKSLDVNDI